MKKKTILIFALLVSLISFAKPIRSAVSIGNTSFLESEKKLPDGLIALEYLESTGTQWIDTGVCINTDTDIIKCRLTPLTGNSNWQVYCGVQEKINGAARFYDLRKDYNSLNVKALDIYGSVILTVDDTPHNIIYSAARIVVDNQSFKPNSFSPRSYTIPYYLFARNNMGSSAWHAECRFHGFSISRDSSIILDLIPIRFLNEDEEWEGAMYDLVSGELFRNAGTGFFVIGPDL